MDIFYGENLFRLKLRFITLFLRFQQDYREQNNDGDPLLHMNLVPVYEELKITGKGIRVAIIDDGIEYTHDDLKDNYVSIFY